MKARGNPMTTPERERAIAEAYRAKMPVARITQRFHVCERTVWKIAKRNGLSLRGHRIPVTRADAVRFAQLVDEGHTYHTAATKLSRAASTLMTACRKFGVDLGVEHQRDSEHERYMRMVLGYNSDVANRNDGGLEVRSIGQRTVRVG